MNEDFWIVVGLVTYVALLTFVVVGAIVWM